MKVWNFGYHNNELRAKIIYAGEIFVTKLLDHFSNKSFGHSVNEIFYYEYSIGDKIVHASENKIFYIPTSKKIEITIELDLQTALNANDRGYLRYLANCYLDRTQELIPMQIKNFNAEAYLKELEFFFIANKAI